MRHPNNHGPKFREQCLEVANAVESSYGPGFGEAVDYLRSLARNEFYRNAHLPDLRWHRQDGRAPGIGDAQFHLHPSVLASLAPGIALRATFGGSRNK